MDKGVWEILDKDNWNESGIKRMEDAFNFLCGLKEKIGEEDIRELSYLVDAYNVETRIILREISK